MTALPALSDAECNAIYYARARAISRGEQAGAGEGMERDRDLIRAGYAAALAPPREPTQAARDVLAERARQVSVEGWTAQHDDDMHYQGQLSDAAACYAVGVSWLEYRAGEKWIRIWPNGWTFKLKDRRRNLVRSGALILAEIERLDRAAPAPAAEQAQATCEHGDADPWICDICGKSHDVNVVHGAKPAATDALALRLVATQAEDEGLWFAAETITEQYLQSALRKLHAAVEHDSAPAPAAEPAPWVCDICGKSHDVNVVHSAAPVAPDALVARLREDHARGCAGRSYTCTCGYDDAIAGAADAIEARDREIAELRQMNMTQIAYLARAEQAEVALKLLETCNAMPRLDTAISPMEWDKIERRWNEAWAAARAALERKP